MGSDCGFAHSNQELKALPDLSRTRLCQVFFQTGQCNAKNCTYAHSKDELVADSCQKTKLCRFWPKGKCSLGDKCRFAHFADELKEPAGATGKPQQQAQQYNNAMVIPAIFDTPPMQARYPATPQHLINYHIPCSNDQKLRIRAYEVPSYVYAPSRTPNDTCSPCNPAPQPFEDDSSREGQKWIPPSMMELTRETSTSTQDSDGFKSYSTFSDGSESDMGTIPCDFGPDSYESSAPDFPPNYGEAQEPFKMAPSVRHLPLPPGRFQQQSAIENDTGGFIDHYTGAVEIMQAPLADETPATPIDDEEEQHGIWQAWLGVTDYQVKNTFISVEDEPTYYPLRCVRSAAGRLTEIVNHS